MKWGEGSREKGVGEKGAGRINKNNLLTPDS
jgi:hypothetical protein